MFLPPTRTFLPWAAAAASLAAVAIGCTAFAPPTRVIILHTTSADRGLREEGAPLTVNHWAVEGAPAGLTPGYRVVKSELEWHESWPTLETDKVPFLPADLSFSKEMLLIAAPPERDVNGAEVRSVVMNEGGIHAYVDMTTPGIDCPGVEKDAKAVYDIIRVPLIDGKDVHFHVDSAPGDSCGSAPTAKITCRAEVEGGREHGPFEENLSTDPGTKVSCVVGSFSSQRSIIDLTWSFAGTPPGATSKMIVGSRGTSVSFAPDVFGTYTLQAEVLDDLQRRGASQTEINVTPKAPLVVQLVWTKFDPEDDPSTFPRIELMAIHLNPDGTVVGAPPPKPAKKVGKATKAPSAPEPLAEPALPGSPGAPPIPWKKTAGCSIENAASYCKAAAMGFTTVMTLDSADAKLFAIGVHFTDDRVAGQAVPCVRTYRAQKLVADLCEAAPQKADTWWQIGVIDVESGKTVEAIAGEKAQAAAKAAEEARKAAEETRMAKLKAAEAAKATWAASAAGSASGAAPAPPSPATSVPSSSISAAALRPPSATPPASSAAAPPGSSVVSAPSASTGLPHK